MDLTTQYLGLTLKNPVVPSASPLSRKLDTIKQMEDAGAAAIVMYSLFEEQIAYEEESLDDFLSQGAESYQEAMSYFPQQSEYNLGPQEYLEHIRKAKEATSIPIIGSLNGVSAGGWLNFAKQIEQAGADALELNIYYVPTSPARTGQEIEARYLEDLKLVKSAVSIPVAMKLSPFFSAMPHMIKQLDEAGADGLVLFNRFYQPDFNLDALEVEPKVHLSTSGELLLPLRWIAIMYGRIKASMAGTTGVHTAQDILKLLMAGADITCVCSSLLEKGPGHIATLLQDLTAWMTEKEYESVQQMKGSMSQKSCAEPAAFERANYMKALNDYKLVF